jgi:uncharacterized protein
MRKAPLGRGERLARAVACAKDSHAANTSAGKVNATMTDTQVHDAALHMVGPEDWRRPSQRLLVLRRLEVGVPAAVAAILLVVAGAVWHSTPAYVLAAVAVVAGLALLAFAGRRYRSWGYAEREDDLLVRRGIAFTRLSVVPYGRMQFIDVTAGPLERLFDLATVRLHTAAAATDARIPGLAEDEAARLLDRLAELGEAQAAGL